MQQQTILITSAEDDHREFLAGQLDADGHSVHSADSAPATISKLTTQRIDVLLLAELNRPADSPALLRAIRAGEHPGVHPAQPAITLGSGDELSTLRAYEAGSDHHLDADSGYVIVRAVLASVTRRTAEAETSRHVHVGELHIDTGARTVEIQGRPVEVSNLEYELLRALAADPTRVYSKTELMQTVWGYAAPGRSRTLDSHACRLRSKLAKQGGEGYIANRWGQGYMLRPLG